MKGGEKVNQLFQAEKFSPLTIPSTTQPVNSRIRPKAVQDSREEQKGFSAVIDATIRKQESAESRSEKEAKIEFEDKASSTNSAGESNLAALAGIGFLPADLSVEQTPVNTDNLSKEELAALAEAMAVDSGKPLTGAVDPQSSAGGRVPLKGDEVAIAESPESSLEMMESSAETKENSSSPEQEFPRVDLDGEASNEITKADSSAKGEPTTGQARLNSEDGVRRLSDQGGLEQEGTMEQFSKSLKETVGDARKAGKESEDRSAGLNGEFKFTEALAGTKDYTSLKNAGEFSNLDFNPTALNLSSPLSNVTESSQSAGEFSTNLTDQIELAEKVVKQIQTEARVMVKDGVAKVEMHLEPKELGKLELSLVIDRDVVTAKFVAESQTVQSIIESNLDNLRSSLQEAGLKAEMLQVGVETSGFGFNGQQEPTFHSKQGFQFAAMDFMTEENEEFQTAQAQVWGRVDFRA